MTTCPEPGCTWDATARPAEADDQGVLIEEAGE